MENEDTKIAWGQEYKLPSGDTVIPWENNPYEMTSKVKGFICYQIITKANLSLSESLRVSTRHRNEADAYENVSEDWFKAMAVIVEKPRATSIPVWSTASWGETGDFIATQTPAPFFTHQWNNEAIRTVPNTAFTATIRVN